MAPKSTASKQQPGGAPAAAAKRQQQRQPLTRSELALYLVLTPLLAAMTAVGVAGFMVIMGESCWGVCPCAHTHAGPSEREAF